MFKIFDETDDHQWSTMIGSDGDIETARFRVVKPRSPRVRKKKFGYGMTAPSMMPAGDVLDTAKNTMLSQHFDVKPYTMQYYLTGYISLNFLEDPSLVILNRSFRLSFVPRDWSEEDIMLKLNLDATSVRILPDLLQPHPATRNWIIEFLDVEGNEEQFSRYVI